MVSGRIAVTVALAAFLGVVSAPARAQAPAPTPFSGFVEVRRILTEVRVVGPDGEPVLGLEPGDFKVTIDGEPAEVESVLFVPSTAAAAAAAPTPAAGAPLPPEGRLIVVLFQVDPAFHPSRTSGLLRMTPQAAGFVAKLGPADRVAVLVMRSHLQLRADFTADHEAIAALLTPTEILEGGGVPPSPNGPSLGAYFDVDEAKDAATMARALELIGETLQPIPGPKSLVLFGYALGSMSAGWRITNDDSYRKAMEALTAARTSVFAIDITDADYHSLERGLRTVSADTGGIYVKTNLFPELAMAKLTRVISSYYELSLVPPPELDDDYTIKIKVNRPRTEVYVRQQHADPGVF